LTSYFYNNSDNFKNAISMTAFTDEDCGPAGIEEKLKRLVPHVKESQAKNADARDEIRLLKVKNTGHSKDAAEGVPTSSNEAALGAKLKAIS